MLSTNPDLLDGLNGFRTLGVSDVSRTLVPVPYSCVALPVVAR